MRTHAQQEVQARGATVCEPHFQPDSEQDRRCASERCNCLRYHTCHFHTSCAKESAAEPLALPAAEAPAAQEDEDLA
jgi:hypothetical protein